jgi:hypothetical protein
VHLVGFIIRIYRNVRSTERQIRGIICADQSQDNIFYYLYIYLFVVHLKMLSVKTDLTAQDDSEK